MTDDDFILARSVAGACALFLLCLAISHLERVALWLPMKGGGKEFNFAILKWLVTSIPVGSSLGCAAGKRPNADVGWRSFVVAWIGGVGSGLVLLYMTLLLLIDFDATLPFCLLGLMPCAWLFSLTVSRARRKPPRIPRQW